ncbi:hypothetical protein TNCT_462471 [Trichonephila clavata]|uniref:Uncharacterized protein n=1 Tax=Trichonephila clavata TaxID=2740835 RepID=A0A8X6L8Z0_TRICU|nr:hypothetical protein TNCT_462471 [Trichonephila clavata]
METSLESSNNSRHLSIAATPLPPNLDDLRQALSELDKYFACIKFCSSLDCRIQELQFFKFNSPFLQKSELSKNLLSSPRSKDSLRPSETTGIRIRKSEPQGYPQSMGYYRRGRKLLHSGT